MLSTSKRKRVYRKPVRIGACVLFALLNLQFLLSGCGGRGSLSGDITGRQMYDSNIFRANENPVSEWRSVVSPGMQIAAEGPGRNLLLRYNPEYIYNYRTDEDTFNHTASFSSNLASRRLSLTLLDNFVQTDDPYTDAAIGVAISDRRGRNRYITNLARTDIRYAIDDKSNFSIGYGYQTLDNEAPSIEDYRRLMPTCALTYYFSQYWQTDIKYAYTYGDFDVSENVSINNPQVSLIFNKNPNTSYFIHYVFSNTDYEGVQVDYNTHSASLGFESMLGPLTKLRLEGGLAQVKFDTGSRHEAPFYETRLTRTLRHGSLELSAKGGYEALQFSGYAPDRDLNQYWSSRLNLAYELYNDLTTVFYGQYHESRFIERVPEEKEAYSVLGASLTYSFMRWFTVGLHYSYHQLQADIEANEYEDHRYYLEIGAHKDLWHW